MTTLNNLLNEWNSDTIQKYVLLVGGNSKLTRKGDRIDYISAQMLHKPSLKAIWQQLDPIAQRAVSTAYHNNGEFYAAAFIAQYGELPPRPQKERSNWYFYYDKEPILCDLFIIDGTIPDDLMPLLTDWVLPPERFQLEGSVEPPKRIVLGDENWEPAIAETELIGRADLLTYLQLVDQNQVKFSAKTNRLTAASTRMVMDSLMMGDFFEAPEKVTGRNVIRPFGLDVFAQESGLMTRTGKLTKAGRDYLRSQDPDVFLTAFEKWSEKGKFDELTRLTQLSGINSRATRLTPAASRREKVIEALSWCPVDTWISIFDFYRAVIVWDFDFEVEKTEYTNLYIGSRSYGELYGNDYWYALNGLYINAVIWEYLATIGAVDVVYVDDEEASFVKVENIYTDEPISLYDSLLYFRINKWGAFLLGQADTFEPTQPRKKDLFTIDKALRVQVVAKLLPNEQMLLDLIAEPVSEKTYQLDTVKLLTAVENGQQLEQLTLFLQANHAGPLPTQVDKWLEKLQQNQGALQEKETAVLITLNQPALITLIQQDKTLANLTQQLDDKIILVPTSKLTRFRKRLKELGYLLG